MAAKSRGAVAPSKIQTNWRINIELIAKCKKEANRLGLGSIPTVVNHIIALYFNNLEKGE